MQLYLVRHGQSMNNSGESSFHNVSLTSLGYEQIHRTAGALADKHFDALYCSPLERALQTASILYNVLNFKPYAHPMFSETGFSGGEPDVTRDQMQLRYPHVILDECIINNGWAPKGGENSDMAYERACEILRWLSARHTEPDASILIVTHGHFGSILIGSLIGLRPDGYTRFSQYNGCISRVDIIDGQGKLRFLNAVSHLPEEMLT